jgi:predicted amidohydrolase
MTTDRPVIAALAQMAPTLGSLAKNLVKHIDLTERARDGGADFVVFPELSLTGYIVRDLHGDVALRPDDPRLEPLRELSRDITVVCGGVEEDERYGLYNAAFIIEDGRVRTRRKVYPPDYGIFEEARYFLRGDTVRPIDTRHGLLGVMVCEDLWHLPLPLLMAYQGARLLVVLSASPEQLPGAGHPTNSELNTQHHATLCRLLSVNLVFVNRVGFEDGVHFWGSSQAVDAFGNVLLRAPGHDEALLFAELRDSAVQRARRESRHFLDDDPHLLERELRRILAERRG